MNTKEKKTYEVPSLTVVTFKAEQGYAESGDSVSSYKESDNKDYSTYDEGNSLFGGNRFSRD